MSAFASPSTSLDAADFFAVRRRRPPSRARSGTRRRDRRRGVRPSARRRTRPGPACGRAACRRARAGLRPRPGCPRRRSARGSARTIPARRRSRTCCAQRKRKPAAPPSRGGLSGASSSAAAVEIVGRVELDLAVEVAPVGRQRRRARRPRPRRASRVRVAARRGCAASDGDELERRPRCRSSSSRSSSRRTASGRRRRRCARREADSWPCAPGLRAEQRSARAALRLVVDGELEAQRRSTVGSRPLLELVDHCSTRRNAPEHTLTPWRRWSEKGGLSQGRAARRSSARCC